MSDSDWVENRIAELVAKHGAVPPPWFLYPNTHPYETGWRMGEMESYSSIFNGWWNNRKKNWDEAQRIDYFRKWPPPPRWLTWMMDVVWDLEPWENGDPDDFDYSKYFRRVEELGFGTQEEYNRDLDDPKWLE